MPTPSSAPARRSTMPRPVQSSGISEEGQGSWYGCTCGPSPPAVTLNPCQRVNVNTFPLSDLVVRCDSVVWVSAYASLRRGLRPWITRASRITVFV